MIKTPLGYILGFIYDFVGNYGWALVIFTILVKVILLPLTLKQQKSTIKMQQVQPKLKELQETYAADKQKLSEETMKLYKEYGVSPMSGCLPLLIQLPILLGLYGVIYKPLTYMLHMGDKITELFAKFPDVDQAAREAEIFLAEKAQLINFDFLGINLADTPEIKQPSLLWLVPVIAAVTTYLTSKVSTSMSSTKEKKEEAKPKRVLSPEQKTDNTDTAASMTKSMTIMMPLMTLWITFTFPATIGVYWAISNITAILQTVVLNGYYKKKLTAEVIEKTAAIDKRKAEKKARYQHKKR